MRTTPLTVFQCLGLKPTDEAYAQLLSPPPLEDWGFGVSSIMPMERLLHLHVMTWASRENCSKRSIGMIEDTPNPQSSNGGGDRSLGISFVRRLEPKTLKHS